MSTMSTGTEPAIGIVDEVDEIMIELQGVSKRYPGAYGPAAWR